MAKKDYNPKAEARKIMPELFEALQHEAKNGKGIARLQAIAALMKLAEPEAMNPGEDDNEVIENTAPPVEDASESAV